MPERSPLRLSALRGLIIDFDGTLARGSEPLPGLERFFGYLRDRGIAFTVATNNSVKTPEQYAAKLRFWGVDVTVEQIMTSAVATAVHLSDVLAPDAACYVIGEQGLCQALQQAGFEIVSEREREPAAVVVGGDRYLTYAKLKNACLHIQHGALFFGTNPDLLVPTEEGLVPEAGATLAALQAATGVAPTVIGKPERPLLSAALNRMRLSAGQVATLGDRLETDVLGGQRLGCYGILVTTGVDSHSSIAVKGVVPDAVFGNLLDLVEAWQNEVNEGSHV